MKAYEKAIFDYSSLVYRRGTMVEKTEFLKEFGFLTELYRQFSDSKWEPLTTVKLIEDLLNEADALAADRYRKAVDRHYRDTQGKVGRSVEEEMENTRGQYALQVMLGLPLGKPNTPEEAKVYGNAGGGHNAFVPFMNPLHHHLIVQDKHRDAGIWWLVTPEGGGYYKLKGWIEASRAKNPRYLRSRGREGGMSRAYWVPPEDLGTVESWWQAC